MVAPAGAATNLDGPDPAFWILDPDGAGGIEIDDAVAGAGGFAKVNNNGATIQAKTTGLVPGHAYTMWVVFFNDQNLCEDGCGPGDEAAGFGVLYGDGKVVGGSGKATFTARVNDGASYPGGPPPPFTLASYEAGPDNEFHVVIRSHGPKIPGQVSEQIHEFGGGCIGPDVSPYVPSAPGECGDVQVLIYS